MKKVFSFGHIAYSGTVAHNRVTVNVELKETRAPVFSVVGNVWNRQNTDILTGGQCIDTIWNEYGAQLENQKLYLEIMRLWKAYHLNDLNAGTPAQMQALGAWCTENDMIGCSYTEACDYLGPINLLVDNGYKYGSGWLYSPIPEADLKIIRELLA